MDATPLNGRVALITGGARRIGRAMALSLARDGASIVINTRSSREEAEATAKEVQSLGARALVHLADVTDENAVAEMIEKVVSTFGRLDIVVNNAANRQHASFTEMSLADWRQIISIILDGAFLCSRGAIPHMAQQRWGRIINIGGLTGHTGASGRAHVVTAKAGLVGLTKALAVEFAGTGITANCVVPGKIGGPRSVSSGPGASPPGGGHPLVGFEGAPEHVAGIVRTLCASTGDYLTGQTIHVSGGLFMP